MRSYIPILLIVPALLCAGACDDDEGGGSTPAEGEGEGPAEGEGEGPAEGEGEGDTPSGPLVDPGCIDGRYREALPDADADLSDLVRGYREADYLGFLQAVLERRYPTGWYLVEGAMEAPFGNCVEMFLRQRGTAADVIGSLSTVVHECGHMLDLSQGFGGGGGDTYIFTEDLRLTCPDGDTTERFGRTFPRSALIGDDLSDGRPPCQGGHGAGCDGYANTYLVEQGAEQGFNSVLEEVTQYINSLAVGYAFHDEYVYSVSERDGILTFLWYLGRYLRLARLEYPEAYELLRGECWREAILTAWGRAWLFLEATEGMTELGIEDGALYSLVSAPEIVREINELRAADGCGGAVD